MERRGGVDGSRARGRGGKVRAIVARKPRWGEVSVGSSERAVSMGRGRAAGARGSEPSRFGLGAPDEPAWARIPGGWSEGAASMDRGRAAEAGRSEQSY
jgi:hypothetical protein